MSTEGQESVEIVILGYSKGPVLCFQQGLFVDVQGPGKHILFR